ncbi:MAG: hypothetical protein WC748_10300 [Legionellales bacterium]|jgi:hypothetical protein
MARTAVKNPEALQGKPRYYAKNSSMLEHATYTPRSVQREIDAGIIRPGKQNERPKDITLTNNGQNTLNYLAHSPVKEIGDTARDLQRARANAIQSATRLSTLIKNREALKQDLSRVTTKMAYINQNPYGAGYFAQTLFSFTTRFKATFYGDENAKSTLAEMRAYDDKLARLAAIEGAIPEAEYHARSDIASAKGLEKDLENAVNKIAAKNEGQLSPSEKFLLTNLVAINSGNEYVPQIVLIKEATDEVLKDNPNYTKVEALLKTPGLELPALSSTAQRLNHEQQISYQLALAVGSKDEKLGNELLNKAGFTAMTPSEAKRLNAIGNASFASRAESRLNTTVPGIILRKENINVTEDYVPEPPFDQAVRAIQEYFVAIDESLPAADKIGQEAMQSAKAAGIPITNLVQLNVLHKAKEKSGDTFDLKAKLEEIKKTNETAPSETILADWKAKLELTSADVSNAQSANTNNSQTVPSLENDSSKGIKLVK